MPLYSPLLNFNHFTHIRQTTSWCRNQRAPPALQARGKIQRVGVSLGEEERGKDSKPTQSFRSVKPNTFLSLFITSKPTHSQTEWKAQLNIPACRLQILFQSWNASFHWGGEVVPTEGDDWFLMTWGPHYTCSLPMEEKQSWSSETLPVGATLGKFVHVSWLVGDQNGKTLGDFTWWHGSCFTAIMSKCRWLRGQGSDTSHDLLSGREVDETCAPRNFTEIRHCFT